MKKILLVATISTEFTDALLQKGYVIEKTVENPQHIYGIITSTKLVLDKNEIDKYPNLQWIARLGSGMEIIDTKYCQQKNILCVSSPAGIANAVAEHVVAMLVALNKNIVKSATEVSNGLWIREPNRGEELENKTIGIIGYGNTGKKVVEKLKHFAPKILVFDKYKSQNDFENVMFVSLETLYHQADVVSYHLPLNTETKDYYNANLFAKPHQLINTSRGEIASTQNILAAFASKQLTGSCLDVLDFEHIQPFTIVEIHKLEQLLQYNCLITPHIAGYSHNAISKMSAELQMQLQNIL